MHIDQGILLVYDTIDSVIAKCRERRVKLDCTELPAKLDFP